VSEKAIVESKTHLLLRGTYCPKCLSIFHGHDGDSLSLTLPGTHIPDDVMSTVHLAKIENPLIESIYFICSLFSTLFSFAAAVAEHRCISFDTMDNKRLLLLKAWRRVLLSAGSEEIMNCDGITQVGCLHRKSDGAEYTKGTRILKRMIYILLMEIRLIAL